MGRPAPADLTDDPRALAEAARAPRSPREVPAREGRCLGGQLRGGRDGHGHGRRVRGKRPDVPDPSRGPHHGHGHREARPDVARSRGVPAAAPAIIDGGADEPLHVDVDGRHDRGRTPGVPPGPARQRTDGHARRSGRSPGAAMHQVLGLSQRVPGLRADGRPRVRLPPTLARSARSDPAAPGNQPGSGRRKTASLPYASSLCGACFEVCPVRIDIPEVLVHLRARVVNDKRAHHRSTEAAAMRGLAWTMRSPRRWSSALRPRPRRTAARAARQPNRRLPGPLAAWTASRDLPRPPRQTLRDWWRAEHRK